MVLNLYIFFFSAVGPAHEAPATALNTHLPLLPWYLLVANPKVPIWPSASQSPSQAGPVHSPSTVRLLHFQPPTLRSPFSTFVTNGIIFLHLFLLARSSPSRLSDDVVSILSTRLPSVCSAAAFYRRRFLHLQPVLAARRRVPSNATTLSSRPRPPRRRPPVSPRGRCRPLDLSSIRVWMSL